MGRPRKPSTEHDRDSKRVHVAFAADEFAAVAALADADFSTLAEAAHDLAIAGLTLRKGEAPKPSGLAAAKETERDLRNRLLAIEVAKQEGKVLSVDQVCRFMKIEYGTMRSQLLNFPQTIPGLTPQQMFDAAKSVQDLMTNLCGQSHETWAEMAKDPGYEE
jgi:hypothetical protein